MGLMFPSAENEQAILGIINIQQEHAAIYECACDCECEGGKCNIIGTFFTAA